MSQKEEAALAISVKGIKKIIGLIVSVTGLGGFIFLILAILMIIAAISSKSFSTKTDYTKLSEEVEQYRIMVENECKNQGLSSDYVNLVLVIMQCSTGGTGTDVMNSSDKESNKLYGKLRGDIPNVSYSIKCGVIEIKELISLCEVKDINDNVNLNILYEAYETDRGYIKYAKENGGYSSENAQEYINSNESNNYRNANFAINAAMYMKMFNSNLKRFIFPLAINKVEKNYSEASPEIHLSGVSRQIVMSACEGEVTNIEQIDEVYNITVKYEDFTIIYKNVSDITVHKEDTLIQGQTIGRVSWLSEYEKYGIKIEMYKSGNAVNPLDYLDVLTVERQQLDELSIAQGKAIAQYAKNCVDELSYKKDSCNVTGCDERGFIRLVFSNFLNYNDENYDIPYVSYEDIINSEEVAFKETETEKIVSQVFYEGDVLLYSDENGYCAIGIYIGDSKIVHMTVSGVVIDNYNYIKPSMLLRFIGQKSLNMCWPLPGYGREYITSDFEPERKHPITGEIRKHNGTDIGAPKGTEVIAAAEGAVINASYGEEAGYFIILDHGNNIKTYYMHASELCVSAGDSVKEGQVIMKVGSTGMSTGNHLHFGLSINDTYVDAMEYMYREEP